MENKLIKFTDYLFNFNNTNWKITKDLNTVKADKYIKNIMLKKIKYFINISNYNFIYLVACSCKDIYCSKLIIMTSKTILQQEVRVPYILFNNYITKYGFAYAYKSCLKKT